MTASVLVALAVTLVAVPLRPGPSRREPAMAPPASRIANLTATWVSHRRRRQPSARAVATWCDDIARRVRSGSSLRDAAAVLPADAATAQATSSIRLAIDRGLSVADAAGRVDDAGPHLRLAIGVIATASRVGGPSAASIERTATLLRQRAGDRDERSAQAAQARLSTHVMTAVPLLMLGVLVATDGDVRKSATSAVGAGCIIAGLVLNMFGWWWMRRIVESPS